MQSLNVGGRLVDLSTPVVMGILNITPDSFYDGGRYDRMDAAKEHVGKMIEEGATIIDVGAASSRPSAVSLSASEELARLSSVVSEIVKQYPNAVLSIDTYHAVVIDELSKMTSFIINDITAGRGDTQLLQSVSRLGFPYIMMHMQGMPDMMQNDPRYDDVVQELLHFFVERSREAKHIGIDQIIIDPGFGFGKTVEHNYALLSNLDLFQLLGFPVMAGISRKSMICKVLEVNPVDALNGTTALHMTALMRGAKILRAHDVKEAMQTIRLWSKLG